MGARSAEEMERVCKVSRPALDTTKPRRSHAGLCCVPYRATQGRQIILPLNSLPAAIGTAGIFASTHKRWGVKIADVEEERGLYTVHHGCALHHCIIYED